MRLIIVEDQEIQAKYLKKILEVRGFTVDWLDNAEEAETRITLYQEEYAVVVLDLGLPKASGIEMLKRIRAKGVMTPVIVLTGRTETEVKIELLEAGADDYMIKPFSPAELIARINSVVRRPSVTLPMVHSAGDLEIDTATHAVRASGVEIQLTLKEYSLLECFLRRPNEVLKREDLYNQVWDFNALTLSNVLDVHMKNLRKKLEEGKHGIRFETVRGVGYRFVAESRV